MIEVTDQTQPNFIEVAQQLGITLASEDLPRVVQAIQNAYNTGVQDAVRRERRKHQEDIEFWKAQAATAEKWRGMALAKDPLQPGQVVQEIQREAMELEREACAQTVEMTPSQFGEQVRFAAAIRSRG